MVRYILYYIKKEETCQSGLLCLFAKEVSLSKGSDGSNPSVSARVIIGGLDEWLKSTVY